MVGGVQLRPIYISFIIYQSDMISQMLQNSTTCTFILYFISSKIYLYSIFCISTTITTIRTFFQLQLKLFSFNKNTCSTSTKNNFIQQHYLFNFNFPVASVCKSAEQIPVRFLQWFSQNHVAFFRFDKIKPSFTSLLYYH